MSFASVLVLAAVTLVLASSSADSAAVNLCSLPFCECPDAGKEVICQCEAGQEKHLKLNSHSLPKQASLVRLSGCGLVDLMPNTFSHLNDLEVIEFDDLKQLELRPKFYSKQELEYKELVNMSFTNIGEINIHPDAFTNFPKTSRVLLQKCGLPLVPPNGLEILCDYFTIDKCNVGKLSPGAIYSDANELTVQESRIGHISGAAFDASVRKFAFVRNTVDHMDHNAMSVACLRGDIVANTFKNQTGSPFNDFGPDPVCVPDPDIDPEEEEDFVYNVVANPVLEFTDNIFLTFTDELLTFPGASNVPLGSLKLERNKVECDCANLLQFFSLVDFDHVISPEQANGREAKQPLDLGGLLFRKEFYATGFCTDNDISSSSSSSGFSSSSKAKGSQQLSLKAFARAWVRIRSESRAVEGQNPVGQPICSDPRLRKPREEQQSSSQSPPSSSSPAGSTGPAPSSSGPGGERLAKSSVSLPSQQNGPSTGSASSLTTTQGLFLCIATVFSIQLL